MQALIRHLAELHEINIVLDPPGLEEAGVTPDQLITLRLSGITLRSALRNVLRPLNLIAVIRDEVLLITVDSVDESSSFVQTYSLRAFAEAGADPSNVISALELAWPRIEIPIDPQVRLRPTLARPRVTMVGNTLVVRGTPRHHEIADDLIRDLKHDLARELQGTANQGNVGIPPAALPAATLPPGDLPPAETPQRE